MGTDTQPYLTGKRSYGTGSRPMPNSGPTSKPQGYVQRELNKQSDSRSGKAEAFLRARDSYQQQQAPAALQQPMIPEAGMPIGNTGIIKDPTGRLYYGGSYQAQAAAQAPPAQQPPAPAAPAQPGGYAV